MERNVVPEMLSLMAAFEVKRRRHIYGVVPEKDCLVFFSLLCIYGGHTQTFLTLTRTRTHACMHACTHSHAHTHTHTHTTHPCPIAVSTTPGSDFMACFRLHFLPPTGATTPRERRSPRGGATVPTPSTSAASTSSSSAPRVSPRPETSWGGSGAWWWVGSSLTPPAPWPTSTH